MGSLGTVQMRLWTGWRQKAGRGRGGRGMLMLRKTVEEGSGEADTLRDTRGTQLARDN